MSLDDDLLTRLGRTLQELLTVGSDTERSRAHLGVEVLANSGSATPPPAGFVQARIDGVAILCRYYGAEPNVGDDVDALSIHNSNPIIFQNHASGLGAGWPYNTASITVDSADPDADYATIAAAIAAVAADEEILFSPETLTCNAQTLIADASLAGLDNMLSILNTTTAATVLTVGQDCHIFDFSVRNEQSAAGAIQGVLLNGRGIEAENLNILITNNGAGDAYGIQVTNNLGGTSTVLRDVMSVAESSANGYGFYIADAGNVTVFTIRDGYYEGDTAGLFIGSGSTVTLYGPIVVGGIAGTGTVRGWYYDGSGNLIAAGSGVLDLDGLADGLVFDADGDTTASAPADGQIDWEIEGTDRFTFEPAGILGAGGVLPDLGSTTAAEKWGNIYLGPNKDVYARDEEEYGLYDRVVNFTEAPHNHFETGFSTLALANGVVFDNAPTVSSFGLVPSCWQVYDNVNGTRVFAQEARASLTRIACRVFTGPFVEFAGLRVDAGDDDDYFELGFRTAGVGTAGAGEFISRVRVGAGAVTTTVLITPLLAGQFFCFRIAGIGGTNFMYYKVDSPDWAFLGSLGNPAWTESRVGLTYEIGTAGDTSRAGFFDWYNHT